MGIGDWLEDKANQIGEAVENAAESATAAVGEAIDDVLDVGADAARSVGWDGVGEALDDAGDQVSSALGGAVEERELGETEDPKELIRGEPSAITEAGNSLGKLSQAADQTGEGLRAVGNISDWHGLGADGYRVGFSPQPGKWTEAADAFTDAKTALEAWASAVSAAQGLAADAIAEWKAAVQERRRVLAWWRSLTDEQKDKTTVTDTWSPRFQAARDILSRARTNRDTAADQTVASLSAAKAAAPEEPPFVSRMAANLEDAAQIGEYANLSFTDGVLGGASGLLQFVRKLNPTDTYNLTHPGEYLENMSNLAGGLVTTAADPGPVVDALIDDARANPFEMLGTVAFDVATAVPTGGAGLAAKAPSLLNKVDNLAPPVRPRPDVPTRAPGDRAAPEGFSPRSDPAGTNPRADIDTPAPQRDTPGTDAPPRDADAPVQDRGAGAAPEPDRPDSSVQAAQHDQPAPTREQPADRADDDGQVEVSADQPRGEPDSPATRPDPTPEAPAQRPDNPSAGPARVDDPGTPGTRPDSDPPGPLRDTYTPPTHPDISDAPGATRPDTASPTTPSDTAPDAPRGNDPAGTNPPGNQPHSDPTANQPSNQPHPDTGGDRPDSTLGPASTTPENPHVDNGGRTPGETSARPDGTSPTDTPGTRTPDTTAPAHTQSTPANTHPTAPRDTPAPRTDPVPGPTRADTPAGRGPVSPAATTPPSPTPGPRPTPDTPAGPRAQPGNTNPHTNLDAGTSTRPLPDSPNAPRSDLAPDTRQMPDQGSTPDRNPADGREPDTRNDDGARDHDTDDRRERDDDGRNDTDDRDTDSDRDNQDRQEDPHQSDPDAATAAKNSANTQTDADVAKCGDPVDAATGEFLLPETDLTLPGILPLVLTRRHRSNYRWGRWFGPTWSSILDMRVVVDENQVTFLGEDGLLLAYPHADPGIAVEPLVGGARYACSRTDTGTYRVSDPEREIIWHFTPEPELDGLFGVYPISAITDRHLNRIRFHYAPDGVPTTITHSGGYHIEIATDPALGRVTGLTVVDTTSPDGPESRTAVRRFDYAAGNLAAVTNGSGATTRYTYDDRDRMLSWTDSRGTTMVNTYDSAGRVILQHGTDGVLNAGFDYLDYPDGTGHITRHINSQGAVTTRGFDHDLRVRDIMDPAGGHTRIDYNANRRPLQVTAPDNAVTRYTYSPDGDVTRIVRPDGRSIDIAYAWRNRPETITHPDGTTARRDWDAHGNLIATTTPGGIRTTYTYHPNGAVATVTEPNTARTTITVDAAGLPITVTDPLGATTHITRDAFGRPSAVTDPLGHTTRYHWSPDGKLLRRLDPDGHHESWTYDGEGNLLTHTNRAGGITRFTYASWDLPISRTDPDGATTRYAYDTERRLTSVTNPLGHTWHYRYDTAGRLISETDYNGATTTYTHDPAGRVATVTPATGVTRHHRYDILGRLTEITTDSGHWRRYTHDPLGRLLTAISGEAETPIHTLDFTHTPDGQLATQTLDAGTPMRFEYDPLGRRARRVTPTGSETRWRWDWSGRPTALDTDGHTIGFTHDPAGQLTEWTIGELAITNAYDPLGRLQQQTVTGFPPRLSTLGLDSNPRPEPRQLRTDEYTWRPDGYITTHTTRTDRATTRVDYTLDPIGRVHTLTRNGTLAEQYSYDALSNITESYIPSEPTSPTPDSPGATAARSTTGSTHREYHNNLLMRGGRTRYHYDAVGRLIRKTTKRLSRKPDVWHFRYDAFDQLTDVWTPDQQWWRYTYDGLGRRVSKQRLETDETVRERIDHEWDGVHLIEQRGAITTRWHYQPGTYIPIAQATAEFDLHPRTHAVVSDAIGSPITLVDPAHADIASWALSELWGSKYWRGDASSDLRFPGQIHDKETELHYNLCRIYDPATGRYLTPDPLGLAPATNPSTYPPNPTVWSDPLGLIPGYSDKSRNDPVSSGPDHIALGINGVVEDFAEAVGARHLMNERSWMRHFEEAILNPGARFSVILDGAEITGAIERGLARAQRNFFEIIANRQPSPFDWEMYRLHESGAIDRATFYLNGRIIPNPFQ
ncbi:hypothetical protein IU501_18180 [Nocardia otitidiscaviarum]|uniref:putative T7SS-secreted protein n=1 Tax=Nocardia otitidiscaviarum TaxID=1823 RepID=UPI0006936B88|nr:DUF6531 domain-containing protein [Nocardia otitidiscaviarum]MBF6134926.1 hypothetical protein [Nocardia otitidiscaviarum]MBF6485448.1 hypothetical protein [Nocardia otitidiscaviarum]